MSVRVPSFSEPDVITRGDREISARWNLGTATVDGWQSLAILTVRYVKGHGYRAMLNTTRFRSIAGLQEDDVDLLRSVVIRYERISVRFSRGGLDAAYTAALMQLWQRAALGDSAVREHLPAGRSPRVTFRPLWTSSPRVVCSLWTVGVPGMCAPCCCSGQLRSIPRLNAMTSRPRSGSTLTALTRACC
jgi:hypothetical protein